MNLNLDNLCLLHLTTYIYVSKNGITDVGNKSAGLTFFSKFYLSL